MSEENKAVVRRFVEEYQSAGHDVAVAEELLADDFVDHSPFGPFSADRNGVIALFSMFFEAFPDLHAVIHEQYADGDKVITRKTFHGTHKGEFMGIPRVGQRGRVRRDRRSHRARRHDARALERRRRPRPDDRSRRRPRHGLTDEIHCTNCLAERSARARANPDGVAASDE